MSLTDTKVKNAKVTDRRYKMYDAKGLYLEVRPSGAKTWRMRYQFAGRDKKLTFGDYPAVSLAMARDLQIDAHRMLATAVDPGELKRQAKRSAKVAAAISFEDVAREWFSKFSARWAESHSSKVLLRLENDLFPWLGFRPISAIEADELLTVLRRVEARGALDSAHRCLGYCSQIFRYAIATARARRNPAADLKGALPPARGGHFASIINPDEIGQLLRAIECYAGNLRTRCALRLAPLTFVRPGELRHAQWAHINLDTAEWRIPAQIMKMKEDLIVPLSRQALDVLKDLRPATGHHTYLFHCDRSTKRPMSENTINAALRRLGYSNDEMTGHGFRAMARTLLDEELGYRVEWIEHQLAHAVKDPNGRAYNRTAFMAGRREMMQGWADYLDKLRETKPKVVALRAA